jgi:hypothetical protein
LFHNGAQIKLAVRLKCPNAVCDLDPEHARHPHYPNATLLSSVVVSQRIILNLLTRAAL